MKVRLQRRNWIIWLCWSALLTISHAAYAQPGAKQIEGTWMGTVTAVTPPLGSFTNSISFFAGGNVIESHRLYLPESPIGPLLETPAHGVWVRSAPSQYQISLVFLLQGAPDNLTARGAPLGTDHVSLRLDERGW